jgi:hypothetical protein
VPSSVESDGAPQYFVLMTKRISFYFERSYGQENVEVLLRPNMVRQMMRPPGIRHPSSVVYSQVDLYPHHDVGQERSSYPLSYPQLVQARPVHRPAMVGILDPVRPYQPSEEAHHDVSEWLVARAHGQCCRTGP